MAEEITFIEVPLIQGEIENELPSCILLYNQEDITEIETNPLASPKGRSEVGVYTQPDPGFPSRNNDVNENTELDSSEHLVYLSKLEYKFIEVDSIDDNDKEIVREQPSFILPCDNEKFLYRQPSGLRIDKVDMESPTLNSPIHSDIFFPPETLMDRNEEIVREQPSFILPCDNEKILYRQPSGLRIDKVDMESPTLNSPMHSDIFFPPETLMDRNEVGVYTQPDPVFPSGYNDVNENTALDSSENLVHLSNPKYKFIGVDSIADNDKEIVREQPSFLLPCDNEKILYRHPSGLKIEKVDMESPTLNSTMRSNIYFLPETLMDRNEEIVREQPSFILPCDNEKFLYRQPSGLRIDKVDMESPTLNSPMHSDIFFPPETLMDRNEVGKYNQPGPVFPSGYNDVNENTALHSVEHLVHLSDMMYNFIGVDPIADNDKEIVREQPSFILPCDNEKILYRQPSRLRINKVDMKSPTLNSPMLSEISFLPETPVDRNEVGVYTQPDTVFPSGHNDSNDNSALHTSDHLVHISNRKGKFTGFDSVADNDKDASSCSISDSEGYKQLQLGKINPTIMLDKLKMKVIEELTAGIWRCGSCGKRENSCLMLDLHENTGCEELSRIECDRCPVVTKDYLSFVVHFMEHQMGPKKKCLICLSEGIGDMKQHLVLQGHYVPKGAELDLQTNTSLAVPQKLLKSLGIGNAGKLHKCHVCKMSFRSKTHLSLHTKTHSKEKLLDCKICGETFENLKNHARKHTGNKLNMVRSVNKPFECDICKRRFSLKQYLVLHQRTHNGEKPFECEICRKTFSLKRVRNAHLRIHSGVKPNNGKSLI